MNHLVLASFILQCFLVFLLTFLCTRTPVKKKKKTPRNPPKKIPQTSLPKKLICLNISFFKPASAPSPSNAHLSSSD